MKSQASARVWRAALPGVVVAAGLLGAACSANTSNQGQTGTSVEGGMQFVDADAGPPVAGGSLAFCIGGETATGWDPTTSQWVSSSYNVANSVFDPLVAVGADGEYVPYLLESITPNEDFTVWTLKIRPGITFHNGTALDAEAVAKNIKIRTERGIIATAFDPIESVEETGDLEVTVTMETPWSTFPYALTAQAGYMQAPEQIATPGTNDPNPQEATRNPIGTGPFKFVEWVQDKEFTARKNENYWQKDADGNALPYLEEISFPVLVDFQSRNQSLDSGQCDVLETTDAASIQSYTEKAEAGTVQMYTDDGLEPGKIFITLNTSKPPFDDPKAREILAYGIDTQQVSDDGFLGVFPPASGPFSKSNDAYITPEEAGYPSYDLEKARQLHEEYKAKHNGEPLKFSSIIPPVTEYQQVAELIRQMGQPFGLEVEIKTEDQPTIVNDLVTGNYESSGTASQGRILFTSPIPDGDYIFIASEPVIDGVSLNFARYDNPTLRQCLDDMRKTDDRAAWKTAGECVQKELAKSLQYIWLVEIRNAVVMQNNVHGFVDQTAPDGQALPDSPNPFYAQVWKKN